MSSLSYPFPLPPLPEQRAITRVLRAVQAAGEARQREAALERERKAALMDYLFTHGTRGEPRKQTPIGEMPESWEVVELGEVVKFKSGRSCPDDLSSTPDESRRVPAYGGNGVMGFTEQVLTNERHLVVGRVGAYCGAVHIASAPNWITDNALYSKKWLSKPHPDIQFLAEYLDWRDLNQLKRQGGQPLITQGTLHRLRIALPPPDEQATISAVKRACDAKIAVLDREIALLDELFQALLEELMTGQVLVRALIQETK